MSNINCEKEFMPVISMFYGIVIMMFYADNRRHKKPHIHAEYQNHEAMIEIPNGSLLGGSMPPAKLKLISAWVEIHKEELMADWHLAKRKETVFKIEPLK